MSSDGGLGDEILEKRDSRECIIRQMEVDIFMNEDAARGLSVWLVAKLEEFEEIRRMLEEQRRKRDE